MGVASLVLGIISLIIAFLPIVGVIALIPAIIGLVLGIVDWVNKKKASEKFSKAVAGTICSGIAIALIVFYTIMFSMLAYQVMDMIDSNTVQEFIDTIQEYDEDFDFSYNLNNMQITD